MSKEKLYVVKNDEGKYWDFSDITGFWSLNLDISDCPTTTSKKQAEQVADEQGGHVVTLVEEPEKVVLTKEQAKIVEDAHGYMWPAKYIADNTDGGYESERLLMEAFINGYTMEKEKKYRVLAPKSWWKDSDTPEYMWHGYDGISSVYDFDTDDVATLFTQKQLEQYNLTSDLFKKEEVTDDGE